LFAPQEATGSKWIGQGPFSRPVLLAVDLKARWSNRDAVDVRRCDYVAKGVNFRDNIPPNSDVFVDETTGEFRVISPDGRYGMYNSDGTMRTFYKIDGSVKNYIKNMMENESFLTRLRMPNVRPGQMLRGPND
jgi:hypothetical protein